MVERGAKAATDHIAKHIKKNDIIFVIETKLVQKFHRFAHDIAATTTTRRRTTGFEGVDASKAFNDHIFSFDLLMVKIVLIENIDHSILQHPGQRKGAIVLGVTANL